MEQDESGWIGTVRTILTTAGPVATIALILLYILGIAVTHRLDTIEAKTETVHSDVLKSKESMLSFAAQHAQADSDRTLLQLSQIKILRQLCVNSARTDVQLKGCVE